MPTWLDYMAIANNQRYQQQQMQMQQQQWQQQQAQQAQQQQAMAAVGNTLPQLFAGGQVAAQPQMSPPPPSPPPGQPSQPMQSAQATPSPPQNGGGIPLPSGPVPGQVNRPPIPAGGVQGGVPKAGVPPFQPMPSAPPQQAQQQANIPAPPQSSAPAVPQPQQGGQMSMAEAVKLLQDKGLSGAGLMRGLQLLMPVLDAQAKQQTAQAQMQFNNEIKVQAIQDRHDALAEKMREADQRADDRALDRADREQARAETNALRAETIGLRKQQIAMGQGEDAKFSPDDLQFLAQQARAGDTSVYQNLGRGMQGAKNIIALRKEVMRQTEAEGGTGADIAAANAEFQGEKAGARTAGTKSATVAMAATEASALGNQAIKLAGSVDNTQYPDINAWRNALTRRGATGDKEAQAQLGKFDVAVNGFKNTYSRAISPTGTPTVFDKQHTEDLFSTNVSPEVFAAKMAQAQQEMDLAKSSPGKVMQAQRNRISGRSAPENAPTPGIPQGWTVTEH